MIFNIGHLKKTLKESTPSQAGVLAEEIYQYLEKHSVSAWAEKEAKKIRTRAIRKYSTN